VELAKEDRHGHAVAADDGQGGRVLRRAERGYRRYRRRQELCRGRDADKGRQEHVVYVVSVGRAGRDNGSSSAVNRVIRRHNAAVQEVRDIVR
jgi:hypothetical protein